ncbi:DUF2867 domain-containing protein [Corynebacterium auriscanis]|uniref:DUF2867 domain-containing protein n=1 Tax=Corynebacterium auriscanis TaxID=99807 RepID=UPI003CF87590
MLHLYGKERGLKRFIRAVPLPLPMDTLSGMWIALVTPAPLGLSVPLAQSMAKDSVTTEHDIAESIPDPAGGLADYPTSVRRALHREQIGTGETKYTQRALYYPQGWAGRLYWGAMLPSYRIIFPVMVKNILKAAEHKS